MPDLNSANGSCGGLGVVGACGETGARWDEGGGALQAPLKKDAGRGLLREEKGVRYDSARMVRGK
jgi:hypothetical protein